MLQHTSGVHEYLGIGGILEMQNLSIKKRSAEESIKTIFGKKAQFEVGKEWSYANSNYLLLSPLKFTLMGLLYKPRNSTLGITKVAFFMV